MKNTSADVLGRYANGERSFQEMDVNTPDVLVLDDANLEGADFSESFLVASFQRANLRGASFRNANVKTSDFSSADLTNADFRGAALDATTFEGAILDGALFAGAHIQGSEMSEDEWPCW